MILHHTVMLHVYLLIDAAGRIGRSLSCAVRSITEDRLGSCQDEGQAESRLNCLYVQLLYLNPPRGCDSLLPAL
jgi:hypothetical protein